MGSIFFKKKKEDIVTNINNFFELSANNIDGERVQMSQYKDKKCIIVVNVASK